MNQGRTIFKGDIILSFVVFGILQRMLFFLLFNNFFFYCLPQFSQFLPSLLFHCYCCWYLRRPCFQSSQLLSICYTSEGDLLNMNRFVRPMTYPTLPLTLYSALWILTFQYESWLILPLPNWRKQTCLEFDKTVWVSKQQKILEILI